jgi:hypothetical protein
MKRPNLQVVTKALARRILFDASLEFDADALAAGCR